LSGSKAELLHIWNATILLLHQTSARKIPSNKQNIKGAVE